MGEPPPTRTHNSARLETLAKAGFCDHLENKLSSFTPTYASHEEIDASVALVTDTINAMFAQQGKTVKTSAHRHKVWWSEEILGPIIKERNRARRWMILSGSRAARQCYWDWNSYVKYTINELKRNHWRAFLAKAHGSLSYKAFRYTQTQTTNAVAHLYRDDRSLATDKDEQAELLFRGTSVVLNEFNASNIPNIQLHTLAPNHLPITDHEVKGILDGLPAKRATGGDGIPNEILKLAKSILLPHLTPIFNACLTLGYFPKPWRRATTAILQKNDKEDYSVAGAYRPIALLSCLGKVLETVITRQMAYWDKTHKALSEGHMGGDANIAQRMPLSS